MKRGIRRPGDLATSLGAMLTVVMLACAIGGAAGPADAQDRSSQD
jgi:hypothetical protein